MEGKSTKANANPNRNLCWLIQADDRDPNAGKWIALGHSYSEVVERILGELAGIEKCTERDLWDLEKTVRRSNDNGNRERTVEDLIGGYFDTFNNIFFEGHLMRERCKVKWKDGFQKIRGWTKDKRQFAYDCDCGEDGEDEEGYEVEDGPYHHENDNITKQDQEHNGPILDYSCTRENVKAVIKIWKRPDITNPTERLRSYLETLLHEMIHAFLNIYTCLCPQCTADIPKTVGYTGHGLAWHRIAQAVEEFVAKKFCCELDLNRRACLAMEVKSSGLTMGNMITAYELGELHLDPYKILDK